tara:strand:+ start:366 stop:554 length:189 start_codon:yes stop_codon:yes gene_type:complete
VEVITNQRLLSVAPLLELHREVAALQGLHLTIAHLPLIEAQVEDQEAVVQEVVAQDKKQLDE